MPLYASLSSWRYHHLQRQVAEHQQLVFFSYPILSHRIAPTFSLTENGGHQVLSCFVSYRNIGFVAHLNLRVSLSQLYGLNFALNLIIYKYILRSTYIYCNKILRNSVFVLNLCMKHLVLYGNTIIQKEIL